MFTPNHFYAFSNSCWAFSRFLAVLLDFSRWIKGITARMERRLFGFAKAKTPMNADFFLKSLLLYIKDTHKTDFIRLN